MMARKPKKTRRKPDLTVVADTFREFVDTPPGNGKFTLSADVETSYDPELVAEFERIKKARRVDSSKRKFDSTTGSTERRESDLFDSRVRDLTRLVADCLRTAETIKDKRAVGVRKKLRDVQREVKLIHSGK